MTTTRKTAKELIDEINAKNLCTPLYVEEAIDMNGVTKLTTLDREEHRWYVIGTVVFSVGEEFFGVRGPVSLNSEESSFEDVGSGCKAFEMEQVPSVTYKRKA